MGLKQKSLFNFLWVWILCSLFVCLLCFCPFVSHFLLFIVIPSLFCSLLFLFLSLSFIPISSPSLSFSPLSFFSSHPSPIFSLPLSSLLSPLPPPLSPSFSSSSSWGFFQQVDGKGLLRWEGNVPITWREVIVQLTPSEESWMPFPAPRVNGVFLLFLMVVIIRWCVDMAPGLGWGVFRLQALRFDIIIIILSYIKRVLIIFCYFVLLSVFWGFYILTTHAIRDIYCN